MRPGAPLPDAPLEFSRFQWRGEACLGKSTPGPDGPRGLRDGAGRDEAGRGGAGRGDAAKSGPRGAVSGRGRPTARGAAGWGRDGGPGL